MQEIIREKNVCFVVKQIEQAKRTKNIFIFNYVFHFPANQQQIRKKNIHTIYIQR